MDAMDLSARELASLIRRKQLSPVEAVRCALERIEARPELNAFITVIAEQAMAAARKAETDVVAGAELGPLHGVPYSAKDLISTAGIRTTMGSAIYADFIPKEDAVSISRAKAAGAILIGKTTTPEFGHKPVATAPLFGRTLNPVNALFTPGASSSGAACAVAAGLGPIALGTDGGGSIRIPASCCGIVGLKPTLGVVPHLQVPDAFSVKSFVGPMARDVADTSILFNAIRGPDRRDPYGQGSPSFGRTTPLSLSGLRVAWLLSAGNRVDSEVEAITTAAVRIMEQQGAIVEPVTLDFVSLERHFLVILQSALAARIGPHLERFGTRLDPTLVDLVEKGMQHTAVALQESGFAKSRCFNELQTLFNHHDVLISPTLSAPPLAADVDVSGVIYIGGKPAGSVRGAWYPYTYPMNLTGHPALSMPCGKSALGLPIGIQLAGRWHDDNYLLGIAALLEAHLGE